MPTVPNLDLHSPSGKKATLCPEEQTTGNETAEVTIRVNHVR